MKAVLLRRPERSYWGLGYNPKDQWNSAVSDILPEKRASERKIVLAEEDIEFT